MREATGGLARSGLEIQSMVACFPQAAMIYPQPKTLAPLHPYGPNIGPCLDPKCRYCMEVFPMDERETPQPQFMSASELRWLVDQQAQRIGQLNREVQQLTAQVDAETRRAESMHDRWFATQRRLEIALDER